MSVASSLTAVSSHTAGRSTGASTCTSANNPTLQTSKVTAGAAAAAAAAAPRQLYALLQPQRACRHFGRGTSPGIPPSCGTWLARPLLPLRSASASASASSAALCGPSCASFPPAHNHHNHHNHNRNHNQHHAGGSGCATLPLSGTGCRQVRRRQRRKLHGGRSSIAAAAAAAGSGSSPLVDLSAVVLGYACLAGSFFRSVPQIAIILRTDSAEGLSLTSNLVELLCFTVTVAYNIQQGYAFNTYGEVFACWIQDVIIVGLIFRHMRLPWSVVAASAAVFAASCAWLFSPLCPLTVLSALQFSTIVVMAVGARVPQIWLNLRRGNAGVLSPLTCLLNVAGCLVRIFTTAVLTRDAIIMAGCVTQLVLNAVLLYQSIATPGEQLRTASSPPPPPLGATADGGSATATGTTATAAATTTAIASAIAASDPAVGGGAGGALGQAVAVAVATPNGNNINYR